LECFVTGHDFSRADKLFIFCHPEPASAGGTANILMDHHALITFLCHILPALG